MKAQGFSDAMFDRPIIGICNSWSEFNNCNAHPRQLAEAMKRGVLMAGGFPLEFNSVLLGEPFMKPITMLYHNPIAMEVEETIRMKPAFEQGYGWMFLQHVLQAHEGCDFNFLRAL